MNRILALLGLITISTCLVHMTRADEIVIERAVFAGGVRDKEPLDSVGPGKTAAPGPLWFWSEIRASAAMIEKLRQNNQLPLQHRWYKNYPGDIPGPNEPPDFSRNLEEIDSAKIDLLASEAAANKTFTYRTASCRVSLPPGKWTAMITDANGNVIKCADGRTCRFNIRVKAGGQSTVDPCQ
jgi:hypothetical protein